MGRPPLYAARQRFDASDGESWVNYIAWSGLHQLTEVVSLDCILCPSVLGEIREQDWQRNVHAGDRVDLFHDLPYLRQRTQGVPRVNMLAVLDEPTPSDLE